MPTTGPAHLSLFTGRYPSELGTTRNAVPLKPADADASLVARLARHGYATAAFVTSILITPNRTGLAGFDNYDSPSGILRSGDNAVDAALAWLDREPRQPVFIWLHLYDAHAPYGDASEKGIGIPLDETRYGQVEPGPFASGEVQAEMEAAYREGIEIADAALGRFVKGARERLGDPLIIVVSDHGESLGEHLASRGYAFDHGEYLDEETLRIPLVVAGQGVAHGRSPSAASIRDLYTTVLEAVNLGDPEAEVEARRDLRHPHRERRIVGIERRGFADGSTELEVDHAGAASDGETLLIVDEEGRSQTPGEPDLVAAARQRAEQATQAASQTLPELSRKTRSALRQLGYIE
jgi:arylsulfatase A-like enzyme